MFLKFLNKDTIRNLFANAVVVPATSTLVLKAATAATVTLGVASITGRIHNLVAAADIAAGDLAVTAGHVMETQQPGTRYYMVTLAVGGGLKLYQGGAESFPTLVGAGIDSGEIPLFTLKVVVAAGNTWNPLVSLWSTATCTKCIHRYGIVDFLGPTDMTFA